MIFKLLPLWCIVSLGCGWTKAEMGSFHLTNVQRRIDLSSSIIRIKHLISFTPNSTVTTKYLFLLDSNTAPHLSYIKAKSIYGVPLEIIQRSQEEFEIDLVTTQKAFIEVKIYLTGMLVPDPPLRRQNEQQFLKLNISKVFYSPYPVNKQSTEFYDGDKLLNSIGPYFNTPGFSYEQHIITSQSNFSLLTIVDLERTIELSQWGNIAVEEVVCLQSRAAALKGPFRRSLTGEGEKLSTLTSFYKSQLPASARDIYYRDDIGIVSTSNVAFKWDTTELHLKFRYPLVGGWKIKYVIGYNVPSYNYLTAHGNQFNLKMHVVDYVFSGMVIEKLTTRIILPQGAKNPVMRVPYSVISLPNETHFSYFDTSGRIKLGFIKYNVIEKHIDDFEIDFELSPYELCRKPIILASVVFVGLMSFSLFRRLPDFYTLPEDVISKGDLQKLVTTSLSKLFGDRGASFPVDILKHCPEEKFSIIRCLASTYVHIRSAITLIDTHQIHVKAASPLLLSLLNDSRGYSHC